MLKRSDTGRFSTRTGQANTRNLRANSEELLNLMSLAFEKKMYYQVCHMGHIATELAMKAVYAKNAGEHPWGHDLPDICVYEYISGQSVIADIRADTALENHYLLIRTAWDMQDRYQRRTITPTDASNYAVAYKEVTKWIYSKYL